MAEIIIMPKLGFNMNEGKLVKWYKKEGDPVRKGENLFSIETDKTNMDIEATGEGVVRKLFIEEGEMLPVTLPIAIVGGEAEDIAALEEEARSKLGKSSVKAPGGVGAPAADNSADTSAAVKAADAAGRTGGCRGAHANPGANVPTVEGGRLKITPRARRRAAEMGLSLECIQIEGTGFQGGLCEKDVLVFAETLSKEEYNSLVQGRNGEGRVTPVARNMASVEGLSLAGIAGTGAGGKITKADVKAALQTAAAGEPAVNGTTGESAAAGISADGSSRHAPDGKEILAETPYAGVRRIIGERLSESKVNAPHVYFTQKVNLNNLLALRKQVNEAQEQKISVTDFISRAVVMTLQKYPDVNAALLGDTIVKYKTVHLGIAVAAPGGLIVPNIKNAEKMGVAELSRTAAGLVEKARNGRLTPDEYTGGTFTISNLGMFGIENFTAVINPPESAILAVSAAHDEVVAVKKDKGEKEIAIMPMMNIQLSADHRVIDGLLAAQFVGEIKRLLETPVSLLV